MCATTEPEFIIFLETHLTTDINDGEINLVGDNQYSTISNSSRTGRVINYIPQKEVKR